MLTENREFNEIYEQYKNLILKAAYTYSGSYSAAEDITQDTFLKLYMGYGQHEEEKYFFMAVYNGKKCGIKLQEKA